MLHVQPRQASIGVKIVYLDKGSREFFISLRLQRSLSLMPASKTSIIIYLFMHFFKFPVQVRL